MTAIKKLNKGQEEAADGFFKFLLSDEKELIIKGGGGVGKTFLMGKLINEVMQKYTEMCSMIGLDTDFTTVIMTATTNKAAEVLAQETGIKTETIHSFLRLVVKDNYNTGESTLTRKQDWYVHHNQIIFIDEASMIDSKLYTQIQESTQNCKIVYVGDHCQLSPVKEKISPIYNQQIKSFELIEPMRNSTKPELMALCTQMRETVKTGIFNPVKIVPGVVDYADNQAMELAIKAKFTHQTHDSRILAYTNSRVMDYNDHIRHLRSLGFGYSSGELLINNSSIHLKGGMLSAEQEIEIISMGPAEPVLIEEKGEDSVYITVQYSEVKTSLGQIIGNLPIPVDRNHLRELIKYYGKIKNFDRYFFLKNMFPDLRQRDACTVHKAQGSTCDTVFVDLTNISEVRDPKQAARMLYVALSRAKYHIVLYGKLADKYGGLTR